MYGETYMYIGWLNQGLRNRWADATLCGVLQEVAWQMKIGFNYHFLAVLPIEIEYLGNITLQREKLIEMKKLEEEDKYQETPTELSRETRREAKSSKRGRHGTETRITKE